MNAPGLFKQWRNAQGLTQIQVATDLKVTGATVSDWENGKKTPGADSIIRIYVLTNGAVPIEAWSDDPTIQAAARALLERRASDRSTPRRRRVSTPPGPPPQKANDTEATHQRTGTEG